MYVYINKMSSTYILTNTDLAIVKIEEYDPNVMDAIQCDKRFSAKDLRNISLYKKGRSHGSNVQVIYTFGKGLEGVQLGRLYPKLGLQNFPHDIRNPLLDLNYFDCDITNAHYTLLLKLTNDWGLKNTALRQYVENRDTELTKVSSNRRVAKNAFLKVAYGGNIRLYNEHYNDLTNPEGDITLLTEIEVEIEKIVDYVWNTNEKYQKLVKKKVHPKFSLFSYILQTEERKCLLEADAYCKSQGRTVGIYIHDGFGLRKLPNETYCPADLLIGMSQHIEKVLGYKLTFVGKHFEHNFNIPETKTLPIGTIVDDVFAAQKFAEWMGDTLRKENDLYIFDEKTGIWSRDENILNQRITDAGSILHFRTMNEQGLITICNYSGSVKLRENMKKVLKTVVAQTEFLEKGRSKSFAKLLFQDGVYDFQNDTFNKGFNKDIVFDFAISYPHCESNDVDEYFVMKHLFIEPFANAQTPSIFLHFLMRGLIGDYRMKKMLVLLGETNSSKGTTTTFLQSAFQGNVGTFNPNVLLLNKQSDAHREMGWLLPHANRRLLLSNEMRIVEGQSIDGNNLKTIVSGGDTITGRQIYQGEETFVNRAMPILFAQDIPAFTPPEAVANRLVVIQYDYSFVDVIVNPATQKKAFDIKTELNQQKYYYAFFQIMKNMYKKWKRNDYTEIVLPQSMIQDIQGLAPELDLRSILCDFEITGNEDDFVSFKEIARIVKDAKYILSDTKLGRALKKLGLVSDRIKIDRKTTVVIKGIKIYTNE